MPSPCYTLDSVSLNGARYWPETNELHTHFANGDPQVYGKFIMPQICASARHGVNAK
jgi:hypothetical protein